MKNNRAKSCLLGFWERKKSLLCCWICVVIQHSRCLFSSTPWFRPTEHHDLNERGLTGNTKASIFSWQQLNVLFSDFLHQIRFRFRDSRTRKEAMLFICSSSGLASNIAYLGLAVDQILLFICRTSHLCILIFSYSASMTCVSAKIVS
jgi:hypothetical protein